MGRATLVAAGFLLTSAGVAAAYFSATSTTTLAAVAGHLTPPRTFKASTVTTTSVTLRWTAPATTPPGTYTYVLAGPLGTGGTCTTTMPSTTPSCSVNGLPGNTAYTWTLHVKFHTWTSTNVQVSVRTLSVEFVGAGTAESTTGKKTVTVPFPSGLQATDLLLLLLSRSHNNSVTCPSGWASAASNSVTGSGAHVYEEVCDKRWTSGTSVVVTFKGTNATGSWTTEVIAFANVTTTTPFDVASPTSSSSIGAATFTPTGLTTASPGDVVVSVVAENAQTSSTPTLSLKTGATQSFTAGTSHGITSGTSEALDFGYKTTPTPTAVTMPTWHTTQTSSKSKWAGITLALKFDPPGSGGTSNAALVQSAANASQVPVTSLSVTLPTMVAPGDALTFAVGIAPGSATVSAVSGGGVTWTLADGSGASPTVGDAEVWYGLDSRGGTGAVTVTLSGPAAVTMAEVAEWRGVASLGAGALASGTGSEPSAGTIGSAGVDLVVSAAALSGVGNGAASVNVPFAASGGTATFAGYAGASVVTGPSTITWSVTGAPDWAAVAAAFSPTPPSVPLAPTVTGVTPPTGAATGGTTVIVAGTNFTRTTSVSFGTAPAVGVTVTGSTSLTAVTPPHAAGAVAVTVTTPGGTSVASATDEFVYTTPTPTPPAAPPAPTVTSLTPKTGPSTTPVTIVGTGFVTVTGVSFGTVAASSFSVTGTTITTTAPAQTVGTTAVVSVATAADGTSAPSAGAHYLYTTPTPPAAPPAPTVTSLTPKTGPVGTTITIGGTNLSVASGVTFGTVSATSVTVSATSITATAPTEAVGATVTVSLLTASGPLTAGSFTYTPAGASNSTQAGTS